MPIPASPLSILQVLEPSGGGSGRHFVDLCCALKARGHSVTAVYSPVRAEERFVDELKGLGLAAVHSVAMARSPGPSDIPAWKHLQRIIAQGRFDIIHGHSSKAGALTRLRLPGKHIPRVYTPHAFRTMDPTLGKAGRLVFGGVEWLLGRFLSDRIICVSQDEYAHAASLGIPRSKLVTIVNGVTPPPIGGGPILRDRFGIPADAFVFGFIGRLSHQKAPERLLSAFEAVAGSMPDAHLLMVGSGELEADIRQRIAHSAFANRIRLTSEITGKEATACFNALVMPSRYEAMSYVALEAASAGVPMILSNVGGAGTVLDHRKNGILVSNSDDMTELAQAMTALATPTRRAAFVEEAMLRKDRYGLDVMTNATEAVYRTLL